MIYGLGIDIEEIDRLKRARVPKLPGKSNFNGC